MLAPGPFTNVARDADGDPLEWCTHWHENGDEANLCDWHPEDQSLRVCIVHRDHFEPFVECVHELHPAECLRCLSLQCIHLNNPDECERCYRYVHQLETTDASADAEAQEGSSGSEESSGAGSTGGNTASEEVL